MVLNPGREKLESGCVNVLDETRSVMPLRKCIRWTM